MNYLKLLLSSVALSICCLCMAGESPRIINIVNFIRQTDYRLQNADKLLFHAVEEQLNLVNKYNLPATFLFQYDAHPTGISGVDENTVE